MALLFAFTSVYGGQSLIAATRTWTGASISDPTPANRNNFWTTPANWAGNASPLPGDDLVFPTAAFQPASINTFASGTSFKSITIESHSMIGGNIVLTGGISATAGNIGLNGIQIANQQTFTVPVANTTFIITSPIDLNGQLLLLQNTGTIVLTGAIGGPGEISKLNAGAGTAILTGPNTFGACNGLGGTLLIAGSQPDTRTRIQQSGVLAGNGTVGALEVAPTLTGRNPAVAPGNNSPSVLNVVGGVEFVDNPNVGVSLLKIDLNGTDVGTGYDQLNVTGTVKLNTMTQLEVTIGGGFVPAGGHSFTILKNDGVDLVSGTFQNLPEGALFTVGGVTLQITYRGGNGNDIVLSVVPGTVAFSTAAFAVNEGGPNATITLRRTGGGNTTAHAAVALQDVTTDAADYIAPGGKLDPAFETDARSSVAVTIIQPDGKILIAGGFDAVEGAVRGRIARLNSDGTLDTSFNPTGADNTIRAMVVQPDGKIIIGGTFTEYNGTARNNIARLNADGSLDPTFDPGTGLNSPGAVQAIALQTDGKIVIGGFFTSYNGVARREIARLNPNGSLDTTFVPDGFDSTVFAVAVDNNGKILVGGVFTAFGTTPVGRIARLNSNGSLDVSFNGGTEANGNVQAIVLDGNGRILIGGSFTSYNTIARNRIARLQPNGALDTSFNPGAGFNASVEVIVLDPLGRLLIGGDFATYNGVPRVRLARLESNGALDPSFDPKGGPIRAAFTFSSVSALALQPDGMIIIGGFFDRYDGVNRGNLARVQSDLVATWGPNDFADKTVSLPIVDDNVFEGDERLNLRIVPLNGAAVGSPATAELTIVENETAPITAAKALNIATRLRVETGDNVMIAGFIITGNASKDVVLRGMGPVLGGFGISDFLADPVLELRGPGGSISINNNWKDTQRGQIEGTPFQPADDRESVIVATLPPAAYTATLTGSNNTTGVGLVEVYDNNGATDSQLGNISTRGLVQGNNSVMIGGFILGGSTSNSRVAIRGIGPSLAQFGLNNVLANPTLELRDANGAPLTSNDDWESDSQSASQLSANNLALSDPKEAGIFVSLPPGPFTAILAGKDGGVGIGLIEIYNLQ